MRESEMFIGEKAVGCGSGIFIVAEIGINHNGSFSQAEKLIDAAVEAGADAVKFQSFRVDKLLIASRDRYAQQAEGAESAYQMLRRCELSWEDQAKLKKHADARGIIFISTPFDEESADFLDSIGAPAFKIASGDITHAPLLRHVASKGKPVLLSTGMSFLSEVADAISLLRSSGASDILLMHCVSAYPAAPNTMNLRSIQTMQSYFDLPVGLSDHSEGITIPLVSAALGASLIEKHFTLDKNSPGPDHKLSMDPIELKMLVKRLKDVDESLGDGRKRPSDSEEQGRLLGRRSIVAAVDIRAHETIASWMLACKRPGSGLDPRHREKVIGMSACHNIGKDTILQWDDMSSSCSVNSDEYTSMEMEADSRYLAPLKRRHA
jgi:N,N'-diacetyllegionaminate synthase